MQCLFIENRYKSLINIYQRIFFFTLLNSFLLIRTNVFFFVCSIILIALSTSIAFVQLVNTKKDFQKYTSNVSLSLTTIEIEMPKS